MLACIQRRQNLSLQNLACVPKSLELRPCSFARDDFHRSRYPSPAELDAFAQRTAKSPLSIKIFQSEVRVPQHKQLNKTVNGLDTTGQHHSPYSHQHSGGHRGLLAVIKASVAVKGVVKSCEGRRTKHASAHATLLPYDNPLNNSYAARHGHKAYHTSSCKPRDVPVEALCASREPSLAPQSELAEVQSLMRQMSRVPHSQAPQLGGEARASPSLQAVAAVAHSDSDFGPGVPPQSGLAFTGAAVLPTQSADVAKAGYLEKGDYAMWQHKHQIQQQPYQQGAVRMYSLSNRESPGTCLPLPCSSSQLPYRPHREPDGGSALKREFSVGQYYAPLWDGVVAAPHSDRYASQVLEAAAAAGTRASRLGYGTDQNPCCGAPGSSVCHAAVLGSGSSSCLQSLECLISEIQPPCIKERMLGRGYEAMGMPQLLEHQQQAHIQLPVYR
uniref:Family with sequence similarity 222 member A n=1 Tax=Gasterosteus aculeatus TaxID=69293 RepID=G3PXJ6_GASAC